MLLAAAREKFGADAKWVKEMKWAAGQMNSLEDRRNDAVHAPFSVALEDGAFKFVPLVWSKSPRARKLADKDLEREFRSYETNIRALVAFCIDLYRLVDTSMRNPPWPERPSLPRPAQAKARRS